LDVEHRLVLQAVVLGEEQPLAGLLRRALAREIPEHRQPPVDLGSRRGRVEKRAGARVLRRHPGDRLRGVRVLQPAIRVGDERAVEVIDDVVLAGFDAGQVHAHPSRSCEEW
jgi:hypothetical protein